MQDSTKERIKTIVGQYIQLFPAEYKAAKEINKQRADTQARWGEMVAQEELGREVLRMPAALHTALSSNLSPEQYTEMQTQEGLKWMQRTFKEFVPNKEIE
jgi:hypothetical protein